MQFGFCHLGVVSVRKMPTSLSEQVTQLLFGDWVVILDEHTGANKYSDAWFKIRNLTDGYLGWIDKRNVLPVSKDNPIFAEYKIVDTNIAKEGNSSQDNVSAHKKEESVTIKGQPDKYIVSSPIAKIRMDNDIITIPMSAKLCDKFFLIDNHQISLLEGSVIPIDKCSPLLIKAIALLYLNTPYQWGGKSIFGMDCSGFTQNVFSFAGIGLKRDASKQALQGKEIDFEQAKANDLIFFCNSYGKINHVGIYLGEGKIIHCSGQVRIDNISKQGIYISDEKSEISHHFCKVIRI